MGGRIVEGMLRLIRSVVLAVVMAAGVVVPAGAQEARGGGQLANSAALDLASIDLASIDLVCDGEVCAQGISDGEAAPRWLAAVWIVQVVENGIEPTQRSVRRFADIGDDHPYVAYIERAAELGVTLGCGDGSRFCPNDTVTRGQMAAFLVRGFDLPVPAARPTFDDIDAGHRFADEIAAIAAAGITIGCDDGSNYCDTATITQRQLRTMLTRGQAARGSVVVDRVEVIATTTTSRSTAIPVRRPATTTTTTTTTTLPAPPMDRLVNDLVVIERAGVAEIDAAIDVLNGDWCDAGCQNVVVTRDPSVGSARWVTNRIIFTVSQGTPTPSSLSFDYATDNSVADATVTIRITNTQQPVTPPQPVDTLIDKTYDIDHFDIDNFSHDFDVIQGASCDPTCQGVQVTDQPGVGNVTYDATTRLFTYDIYDIDDVPAQAMFEYETANSNASATVTVNITVNKAYKKVSVGSDFWCGINAKDAIECYGNSLLTGNNIPSDTDFVDISSGVAHSCARKSDDTVKCWGANSQGESADRGSTTFRTVDAGSNLSCGVKTNFDLSCWGSNALGVRNNAPSGAHKAVSVGFLAACAIEADGDLICWGDNADNLQTEPEGAFTALDVGLTHACAVKSDETVECWGGSEDGKANDPPDSDKFVEVSAGERYSCGRKTDNTIKCWGNNTFVANAPQGTFGSVVSYQQSSCALSVNGLRRCWGGVFNGQVAVPDVSFKAIAASGHLTCGIVSSTTSTNNTVKCWGSNTDNEATAPSGALQQLAVSMSHGCGVETDGDVVCWGDNSYGQDADHSGNFQQVSAGPNFSCRLDSAGNVNCWGESGNKTSPPAGVTFNYISSGDIHSCGIETDKTPRCWGLDTGNYGRLSVIEDTYVALDSGVRHSCGITEAGLLKCWGDNGNGQAPTPSDTDFSGANFQTVAAGFTHTCAVKTDGTIKCWGDNSYGKATPPSGSSYVSVVAGSQHTCALTSDNNMICWGVTSRD